MELLNQSYYKVWKTCMESYLVGEVLWDVVNGSNTNPPVDGPENSSAYKKWKQINAKCKSAHEIWGTLDRLFYKKNEARLQILENEFANTTQGNLSIA
ncbi:hypothetical protein KY290_033434 [Solanum tuberosum]|uniref:DUF4219 domain-containing protein n=1 Tax=Solanum tuberosum TaxID=4113 RepID=A0ABQ7U0Q1_SOLTU|nr:hypothetical protein KY289_034694 [Solanum tuberosum]KAH0740391.1 hypothetical protein KY290_033434 [Solanum tuberosum]